MHEGVVMDNVINNVINTLKNLSHDMVIKLLASSILVAIGYHAAVFFAFGMVVFLDLFTRWLAISHKRLIAIREDGGLINSFFGIPAAHRAGLINSYVMRKTFFSKMLTYLLLIYVASLVDYIVCRSGGNAIASSTVITYLAMTELLSVVENLDEAGVSAVHDLIQAIKDRRI